MTKWYDYLVFTKAYPFIIGLIFSQTLADNTVVIVLITYLKQEWKQSLRAAAAIVNMREFITEISKVYVAHLSDDYFGRFPAVLWLTGSYTLGLMILWVLEAHNTYNIKMLYLALFLISLGKAGDVCLKSFISDQLRTKEPSKSIDEQLIEGRTKVWRGFPWFLAALIASFLNASWDAYSILLTVILVVELLGFWLGKPLYAYQFIETESAWKKIYYVGKAALLKRHLPNPKSAKEFYENTKDHYPLMPNIYYFRWLDKAAMIDQSRNHSVQQQVDMKTLFTVSEVEEVKYIAKIIPSFPSLLIYSIIEAIGTTFFFNQANEIDNNFPVIRLYILKNVTSYCASFLWSNRWEKLLRLKILTGMVCSVLCSLIAWRVEIYMKHVEKSNQTISIWWLTPQFIFLGLMEGLLKDGIEGLFKHKVSESMGVSGTNLVQFMIGIGRLLSFVSVLKLGSKVNEINRFGRYYYGVLGVTSVVNASISGPIVYTILKELPMIVPPTPSVPTSPNPKPPRSPSPSCSPKFRKPTSPSPSPSREGECMPEDTECKCPSLGGCRGSCNGWIICEDTDDCCPFSDDRNSQLILECPPWIPDWNCISSIEGTSTNYPPCMCGGCCNNGPPVICNSWIVTDDCTPYTRDNIWHNNSC